MAKGLEVGVFDRGLAELYGCDAMKNSVSIVLGLFLLGVPLAASAHPGNTDSSGCHTCKTNCSNWGLSYGEYHCHNAKNAYQPEDPIRSHYGDYGTGYTEYWPDYEYGADSYSSYSYPTTPSCPLFSTYDSLSDSCECNYGYVVDGNSCVDGNTVCHRKMGYNSSYSGVSNSCECDYGYKLDSIGQCVSRDQYCRDIHGYNAEYDILSDSCACEDGYVNDGANQCIGADTFCRNEFGLFARYDSLRDTCSCSYGYELAGGRCVEIEEENYSLSDEEIQAILNPLPSPQPAAAAVSIPAPAPAPIPVPTPTVAPTVMSETAETRTGEPIPESTASKLEIGPATMNATAVVSLAKPQLAEMKQKTFLEKLFEMIRDWFE